MAQSKFYSLVVHRLLPSVLAALLLTGCGYHLRGGVELIEGLDDVYVQGAEDDFALRNAIAKVLRQAGATVVEDPTVASGKLLLKDVQEVREPVSFDENGDAARYRLELRVSFATTIGEAKQESGGQEAKANISYAYNAAQPLLMEREEQRLFRQLRDQVAQTMLRLMASRTKPATVQDASP